MEFVETVGSAQAVPVLHGRDTALKVTSDTPVVSSGVRLLAPGGHWDLGSYTCVLVDVTNTGSFQTKVRAGVIQASNPGEVLMLSTIYLDPGKGGTIWVGLRRPKPDWVTVQLDGMVTYPWGPSNSTESGTGAGIDASQISAVQIFVKNYPDYSIEVNGVRAAGTYNPELPGMLADPDAFFPFVDHFGQYIHQEWPGKISSEAAFQAARETEASDIAANPERASWDRFGGWADGPQLTATGWFRTTKYGGKWWLVDPDGHLFVSTGFNQVTTRLTTPVGGPRARWFKDMPASDSAFAEFYSAGRSRTGKTFNRTASGESLDQLYDFAGSNLLRKYGEDWRGEFARLTHQRMRSWGFNTIGNWSDSAIIAAGRTPYTANLTFRSTALEASHGYWGKFPDVFAGDFAAKVQEAMAAEADTTAKDPWCIGYFAGNEMEWGGNEVQLALETLACPASQPAKMAFVDDLKAKYSTIEALNTSWGTAHASWQALSQSNEPPDISMAYADLQAFHIRTSDTYFRKIRDAIKAVAPNHLFLGCRFAGGNPASILSAGKYCDVVSFNLYGHSASGLTLPYPADVPLMIGEYSFWSTDHGSFNGAGQRMDVYPTQAARAAAFTEYVRSVLEHPQLVGCHWFKYQDQNLTGRTGDGENFQFGFLDITDNPYPAMVAAMRRLSEQMYSYRLSGF